MEKQLEHEIKRKIESMKLNGKSKMLSESVIAKELGVDRHSVRRAIRKCSKIGMLHPIRGRGYAVNVDEMVVNISSFTNYTDGQLERKKRPMAEIIDFSLVQPHQVLSRYFDEKIHTRIWLIRFKRYLDDIPFSTTRSYLPFIGLEELNLHLKDTQSLYRVLKNQYGISPRRMWSTCEAEDTGDDIARILQIPGGFPVLKVCSLAKNEISSEIIEYCETYFRSDLVKVKFDIESAGNNEE